MIVLVVPHGMGLIVVQIVSCVEMLCGEDHDHELRRSEDHYRASGAA